MKTCQTCGHWRRTSNPSFKFGACSHPKVGMRAYEDKQGDALIRDSHAVVHTGPSFGCVHHVEREAK